jgi:N-acetyl-anhydromuramyl-L-alanine amidase AmpD
MSDMGYSKLATYTKISPNKTSPRNHEIDTVTIHCTAGEGTAEKILNLAHFVNYSANNGASCNYAVGCDGSIGVGVDENDRSWCSSNRANDHRAITIEVSSSHKHPYVVTEAAYKALIDLLVDICQRHPSIGTLKWKGDKSLIGKVDQQNMTVHRWFANKACPGDYLYNKHAEIVTEVNKRLGVKVEEPKPVVKPVTTAAYTLKQFVKDVQKATGAAVDGIPGNETISKTVTLSAKKNARHAAVKAVQKRLLALGYTEVGTADGIAGAKFTAAVKHFQKDTGCVADGEITAKNKTWKKLLGMA